MRFTTRLVIVLLLILFILAVFLYSLHLRVAAQIREETEDRRGAETFNSYNTDTYNLQNPNPGDNAGCPNLLVNKGDIIFLYNMSLPENQLVQTFKTMDEYQVYVLQQQSEGKNCPLLYLRQEVNTQGREVYRVYTEATMGPGGAEARIPTPDPMPTAAMTTAVPGAQEFGQQGRPPMPPPFLETVPLWDLHHQPPLYVEGGLPALPMEKMPEGVIPVLDAGKTTDVRFNQTGLHSYDPYGLYVGRFTDVDILHKKTADVSSGLSANAADPNWGGVMYTQQMVRDQHFAGSEVRRAIYPQLGFV